MNDTWKKVLAFVGAMAAATAAALPAHTIGHKIALGLGLLLGGGGVLSSGLAGGKKP